MPIIPIEEVPEEHCYTVAEASRELRCSDQHVRDLINGDEIGWCDISKRGSTNRKIRIPAAELRKYLAARTIPARISA